MPSSKPKHNYGIAEWYGRLFNALSNDERRSYIGVKKFTLPCPFMQDVPSLGPQSGKLVCNKEGGVCSIRKFSEPTDGDFSFGQITSTCPNRFLQGAVLVEHIASTILGTNKPLFAKELPFLMRPKSRMASELVEATEDDEELELTDAALIDAGSENVGRIDLVFVDPEDNNNWCAVEIQAVYFSGASVAKDMNAIAANTGNGVPMPGGTRRPDFRSSGPKRLMPQLMIKVPTLRRWGKKLVVVIDRPFLENMDQMPRVSDISNCDIVWVVVEFSEKIEFDKAKLTIFDTIYTTLEDAVKGLTSGDPTTLSAFEEKLDGKSKPVFPDI